MGTYLVIAIGNCFLLGIIRWFTVSGQVQQMGGATIPNVVGLGVCCTAIEIGFLSFAMDLGAFSTVWSKLPVLGFSLLTAMPWAHGYFLLLREMTEDTSDRMAGFTVSSREKVDLRLVYEDIENGRLEKAEKELAFLREA